MIKRKVFGFLFSCLSLTAMAAAKVPVGVTVSVTRFPAEVDEGGVATIEGQVIETKSHAPVACRVDIELHHLKVGSGETDPATGRFKIKGTVPDVVRGKDAKIFVNNMAFNARSEAVPGKWSADAAVSGRVMVRNTIPDKK